jgi:hypothetical protein
VWDGRGTPRSCVVQPEIMVDEEGWRRGKELIRDEEEAAKRREEEDSS